MPLFHFQFTFNNCHNSVQFNYLIGEIFQFSVLKVKIGFTIELCFFPAQLGLNPLLKFHFKSKTQL